MPRYVLGFVALVTGIVFVWACVVMEHHGGANRAWETLIGARSPAGQAHALAILLSGLGYALVPTAIGLAAADAVSRFTNRRMQTLDEAKANIATMVAEAVAAADALKRNSPTTGPGA